MQILQGHSFIHYNNDITINFHWIQIEQQPKCDFSVKIMRDVFREACEIKREWLYIEKTFFYIFFRCDYSACLLFCCLPATNVSTISVMWAFLKEKICMIIWVLIWKLFSPKSAWEKKSFFTLFGFHCLYAPNNFFLLYIFIALVHFVALVMTIQFSLAFFHFHFFFVYFHKNKSVSM